MADLALYIRQHHAMRDDAQLGALALAEEQPMVSFTHNDAGTSEAAWAGSRAAGLPDLPLDDAALAGRAFIVLAAHPDDESLGAGGLLARLHAVGATVRVLLCTAGEGSRTPARQRRRRNSSPRSGCRSSATP